MRWLARPTRCSSRATPLGAPTCTTWSTPPQSMPRSSEAVATTARSRPDAIAASTLRRCSTVRLPWCSAIGRLSSFKRHSAWKQSSAWARVLTKTMVTPASRMRRYTSGMEARPICPPQGRCPSGSMIDSSGAAPPRTCTSRTSPGIAARRQEGAQRVGMRHGGGKPDPPRRRRQGGEARQAERELVAALGAGERVDLVHHRRAEAAEHSARPRAGRAAAPGFPAWSAAGWAAPRAAGRGGSAACRRCASRSGWAGPSPRPARARFRAMSTASALSGET